MAVRSLMMEGLEPFGWRTSWIAVKMAEPDLFFTELRSLRIKKCDWEEGLREASRDGLFFTPSIDGWTLIVGVTLPDASAEETLPLIVRFSEKYGSAQYFGNHRVVDYYAWAKAEGGRLIRAYAFLGEKGFTPWDRGDLTDDEIDLGLTVDEVSAEHVSAANSEDVLPELPRRFPKKPRKYPTEEDVFALARRWSIDPTQIEQYQVSEASGVLGYGEELLTALR